MEGMEGPRTSVCPVTRAWEVMVATRSVSPMVIPVSLAIMERVVHFRRAVVV